MVYILCCVGVTCVATRGMVLVQGQCRGTLGRFPGTFVRKRRTNSHRPALTRPGDRGDGTRRDKTCAPGPGRWTTRLVRPSMCPSRASDLFSTHAVCWLGLAFSVIWEIEGGLAGGASQRHPLGALDRHASSRGRHRHGCSYENQGARSTSGESPE